MVRIIICSLLHSRIAGHTLPVADHNQEEVAVHNPFEVVVRILEVVAHILEAADHSPSGVVAHNPFVVAVRSPFVVAVHTPSEVVRILEVAAHSPSGVVGRILTADRILQLEAVDRSLLGIFLELPVFPACSSGTVAVS